jgi:hypothetical protein
MRFLHLALYRLEVDILAAESPLFYKVFSRICTIGFCIDPVVEAVKYLVQGKDPATHSQPDQFDGLGRFCFPTGRAR